MKLCGIVSCRTLSLWACFLRTSRVYQMPSSSHLCPSRLLRSDLRTDWSSDERAYQSSSANTGWSKQALPVFTVWALKGIWRGQAPLTRLDRPVQAFSFTVYIFCYNIAHQEDFVALLPLITQNYFPHQADSLSVIVKRFDLSLCAQKARLWIVRLVLPNLGKTKQADWSVLQRSTWERQVDHRYRPTTQVDCR